jgi:hypothetical protein
MEGPLLEEAAAQIKSQLAEHEEDSPEHKELSHILNGMALGAAIRGESLPGLEDQIPSFSKSFQALTKGLTAIGEEHRLLGSMNDLYGAEGRLAVREAMGVMADDEIVDLAAGENSPYGPIGAALLDEDSGLMGPEQKAFARDLLKQLAMNDMTTNQAFLDSYAKSQKKDKPDSEKQKNHDELIELVRQSKMEDKDLEGLAAELTDCLSKAQTQSDIEACQEKGNALQVQDFCSLQESTKKIFPDAEPNLQDPNIARVRHVCETGELEVLDQEIVSQSSALSTVSLPEPKKAWGKFQSPAYIKHRIYEGALSALPLEM